MDASWESKHRDVFISYSSKNQEIADLVVADLERHGVKCWIASRDILPGQDWAAAITKAVQESGVFVLLLCKNANLSKQVRKEVHMADHNNKIIIVFRLDNSEMNETFQYQLSGLQWLDATSGPLEHSIADLRRSVIKAAEQLQSKTTPDDKKEDSLRNHITPKPLGTLSRTKLHSWIDIRKIQTITFLNTLDNAPSSARDLSEEGNGSVMAWRLIIDQFLWQRDEALYIAGDGGVLAPQNCYALFSYGLVPTKYGYCHLKSITGGQHFITSNVTSMREMFCNCHELSSLDLNFWDTSKVKDMSFMFYRCDKLDSLNIRSWNTANVKGKDTMFTGTIWEKHPPI